MSDPWKIFKTSEYEEWFDDLSEKQKRAIENKTLKLEIIGPTLGRPDVDHIKGSQYSNLKELRVSSDGALRILFIFDPWRTAVLLIGGNKSAKNEWNAWYQRAIPIAEKIYERYLEQHRRKP